MSAEHVHGYFAMSCQYCLAEIRISVEAVVVDDHATVHVDPQDFFEHMVAEHSDRIAAEARPGGAG
jgi:hypothetical protein